MKAFSQLLERLAYTPSRNAKLKLMSDYFQSTPDPDRGWALAALTDGLPFSFPLRRTLSELVATRIDPELFRLSRDYVGDTAETVALIWPEPDGDVQSPPRLADVVARLSLAGRDDLGRLLEGWLDALDANARWALLKLMGGAPRVGVSARLAKTALAEASPLSIDDIEEVWHALSPPYIELFAWIDGGPKPDISNAPVFRPLMLSHPLQDADLEALDVSQFAVEWKWDGIRVQIAGGRDGSQLYSRSGDDISGTFPDVTETFRYQGVFDGELLVLRDGVVAAFSELQQRLNRKTVSRAMLERYPAHVRLYDALMIGDEDLRQLPFVDRRARLEAWHAATRPPKTDLSSLIDVADKSALEQLWSATRASGIEGLMLKRRTSPYLAGRPKGHWYKWKRNPLLADCVLMYAQRGSGKRSSYHSDFTFGAWAHDPRVRGRLRCRAALNAAQVGDRHALPANSPHPMGQTCRGSRRAFNARNPDRTIADGRPMNRWNVTRP